MTLLISTIGLVGRFAAALLNTALGWASSLLFGRIPRSHQIFVVLILAGSLLWMFLVAAALAPVVPDLLLGVTPHPPFIDNAWLRVVILAGVVVVPLGVGLAGYLVPADGDRPTGLARVRELLRGYLLTPLLGVLLLFLPAVGISRKARSLRRGWSDTHIPIVVKPKGYDRLVVDLREALGSAGLLMEAEDAPAVLSLPALLLTSVAGGNVRKLRADRLVELEGPSLRIGIYPSDIAISGPSRERTRARAAIFSRLGTTAALLTTSAEAQAVEDRLARLAERLRTAHGMSTSDVRTEFAGVDETLLDLPVPTEEWDILYRLRLQVERDALASIEPGTAFPGDQAAKVAG
jgi:hypothetical protein